MGLSAIAGRSGLHWFPRDLVALPRERVLPPVVNRLPLLGLLSAKLVDLEEALRVDVELLLSDEIADLLDGGWVPSGRNRLVPYRYSNVTITTRGICVSI